MKEKECFKCKTVKPLDSFYPHPMMADGHLNKCKKCNKRDVAENYRKRKPQYQEYERKRFQDPDRKKKISAVIKKSRKENPLKYKARTAMSNAIRRGDLVRTPCEKCGDPKVQGHHDDYTKPLDVRWLCFTCHRIEHGQDMTPH